MIVTVEIQFLTPCLGKIRSKPYDKMHRDKDENVILLQTWWTGCLSYAAKALNKFHHPVKLVQVDPVVVGKTKIYRRYYESEKFTDHEAFLAKDTIQVSFCLPSSLSVDDFLNLLEVGGRYVGISPYGYREDYGRFTVIRRVNHITSSDSR